MPTDVVDADLISVDWNSPSFALFDSLIYSVVGKQLEVHQSIFLLISHKIARSDISYDVNAASVTYHSHSI